LEEKVAAPVWKFENTAVGIRHAYHVDLLTANLALTSSTSGGRSVGIVRSRTQATEFLGGWIGARASLDIGYKRKLVLTWNRTPDIQPITLPTPTVLVFASYLNIIVILYLMRNHKDIKLDVHHFIHR
jgi:hypothetical protein